MNLWLRTWESHLLKTHQRQKRKQCFPPWATPCQLWPHFVFSHRTYERSQNNVLLGSSSGFTKRDRKSLPAGKKKSSVIYRKWLEALYPASVVSCPQSPNHPHNLQFCGQRALTRQNKPFTLSQWRWILKSGVHCDCRQSLRRGQVGGVPRWRALPRRSLIFSKREG